MAQYRYRFRLRWLFWLVNKYLQGRSKVYAGTSLWLSVLGILIGVTTLISVLTGMSGMQSLLTEGIDELTAYHVQVLVSSEQDSLKVQQYIEQNNGVENVTLYREAPMLLNTEYGQPVVAVVRAVEPEGFMTDKGRKEVMQMFGPVLDNDLKNTNHMWVGSTFAYENGFSEGDRVVVISAENQAQQIEAVQHNFLISASYQLGNPNIEKNYVFIGLSPEVEGLFYSKEYYLGVKLKKKFLAESLKQDWEQDLNKMHKSGELGPISVRTGRDANQAFFNALRTEKSFLQLLVSLIFLVVAFQIFQSTRRTVYARIPELMLLRALGTGSNEIRLIFLIESLLVGLVGTGLGIFFGLIISKNMNEILYIISTLLFQTQGLIPHISTHVAWQDLLVVGGSALFFSCAAGWLATRRLLHISPIEVLRNE